MTEKEEMKSSFTLQTKISSELEHCHLQDFGALFHTLGEGGITHLSFKRSPSNMNMKTIPLVLV